MLDLPITPFGSSYQWMYRLELLSDSTYFVGEGLGFLSEDVINQKLKPGTAIVELPGGGFMERFEKIGYGGNWGTQGRFELRLLPTTTGYEVQVVVYFDVDVSKVEGTAEDVILRANTALAHYWGANPLHHPRDRFVLSSPDGNLTIPIECRVEPALDSFKFDIYVYPDSTPMLPGPKYEAVNMSNMSWQMRETLSWRGYEYHEEAGRGPHEFGHMMGVPHDFGDVSSAMSGEEYRGLSRNDYFRYYEDENLVQARPYASHFKLVKVWVQVILANKFNQLHDLVVVRPYAG